MARSKEQILYSIGAKRGARKRERKKKFQYLKNTKQLKNYLEQKSGIKRIVKKFKTSWGLGVPQLPIWKKFINFIKEFFNRIKLYAKNLLRYVR